MTIQVPKSPDIWVPRNFPVVEKKVKNDMAGRYKLTVRRPDGEVRLETDWIPNLITDTGLDNVAQTDDYAKFCYVGTGNTAPANGNTSLVSQVAGDPAEKSTLVADSTGWVFDDPEGYKWWSRTYRFDIGEAEGVLAEVGVGPTPTTLTTRSLIRDGGGSPTTVTVLSDEILDVTYEFQFWVGEDVGVTSTATLDSEDYDTEIRLFDIDNGSNLSNESLRFQFLSFALNATRAYENNPPTNWSDNWSGTSASCNSLTQAAYTPGSHKLDAAIVWNFGTANYTDGIKGIGITTNWSKASMRFELQSDGTKGILKDNTQELTVNWSWSWARRP